MTLPTCIVVGAPKCGTSALHALVRRSGVARTHDVTELHHFSAPELAGRTAGPGDAAAVARICAGEADYRSAFPETDLPVVEFSPSYLRHAETVALRIRDRLGPVRIVVLVREPVKRTASQYWHQRRLGLEPLALEDALAAESTRAAAGWGDIWEYVRHSDYAPGIERFLDVFGPANVLILAAEHLDEQPTLDRLADFLGCDPFDATQMPRANSGGQPRNRVASAAMRADGRAASILKAALPAPARHRLRSVVHRIGTRPLPSSEQEPAASGPGRDGDLDGGLGRMARLTARHPDCFASIPTWLGTHEESLRT